MRLAMVWKDNSGDWGKDMFGKLWRKKEEGKWAIFRKCDRGAGCHCRESKEHKCEAHG